MMLITDLSTTSTRHKHAPLGTSPTQPPFLPSLSFFVSIFFSMCPVSPLLFCVSFPLFSLSLCVSLQRSTDAGAAWTSSSGPVSVANVWLRYIICYIPSCCIIYICILYIRSGVSVFVFSLSLSLSLSLHSLCPVSLSFSSFTRPTLSRKVPPCKPGPAQGFFLLKTVLTRGFRLWVSDSVKHLKTI